MRAFQAPQQTRCSPQTQRQPPSILFRSHGTVADSIDLHSTQAGKGPIADRLKAVAIAFGPQATAFKMPSCVQTHGSRLQRGCTLLSAYIHSALRAVCPLAAQKPPPGQHPFAWQFFGTILTAMNDLFWVVKRQAALRAHRTKSCLSPTGPILDNCCRSNGLICPSVINPCANLHHGHLR